MRKPFIDNLRWIAVLFLFPYHTARIFDSIHAFYIKGAASKVATDFVLSCTPWFMPVLFVLAGLSTRYALQKRSNKEYVKERFAKLFIPLVAGLLLLVPVQTYFAEIFNNGYEGTYWEQYILFFTKVTDFSGYSGGFTPGQLWFVFYLFVISLAALPLIHFVKERNIRWRNANFSIIPLFLITLAFSYVLDITGKSMGEYFSLFFLGYFVLSEETVQEYTDKHRLPLFIFGGALTIFTVAFQISMGTGIFARGTMILTSWICILAILGMGRHYLNFQNKWTKYLSASSFTFYLFHQSWIVLIGFYTLQCNLPAWACYILILIGGILGSILAYEVCKRFRILRFIFAIKSTKNAPRKNSEQAQ